MTQNSEDDTHRSHIWFVDSGCSNHMTGFKTLFSDLDELDKQKVRLGNGNTLHVEGKGTVQFELSPGKFKFLHNIQYVPALDFNLISVGQLLSNGYLVIFDNAKCCITQKKTECVMVTISMTKNQMFPLDVSAMGSFVLAAREEDESWIWHLRYRHLHLNALRFLKNKEMVYGLPIIIT